MKIAFHIIENSNFDQNYWRGVRVVEGARLESVYRSKAYRGFESLSLRNKVKEEWMRTLGFVP
jgi:hypothetical protein